MPWITGLATVLPELMELTPGMVSSILASEVAPPFSRASEVIRAVCWSLLVRRCCPETSISLNCRMSSCILSVMGLPGVTARLRRMGL